MNKKLKIGIFCTLAIVFSFFVWFLSDDIFSGDDMMSLVSWLTEGGKYNLDSVLTAFLPKVFGEYLPLLFHVNPHEFSMTVGAVIRGVNVSLLCFVMSLFLFIGRQKTKMFPVAILVSALYFCYASANMEFDWINPNNLPVYDLAGSYVMLTEYSQHFGQLVTFILGLFSLYFLISYFVQNKLPEKKYLFLICGIAFLTAVSSMFVSIVVGVTFSLVAFYLFFANIQQGKNELIKSGKTVYFPLISYYLGMCVFAYYPGYLNYFSLNFNLPLFVKSLGKTLVLSNSFETALIIALSAILFFLALNKTTYIKRAIFAVFSAIFASGIYFSLFTQLNDKLILLLTESQILYRLLLFSFVLFLFSSCLKELTTEVKTRKVISVTLTVLLIIFAVIQMPYTYTTMRLWRVMSKETKSTTYCLEKMYRFYSLRHKTALLPEDALLKIFKIAPYITDKSVKTKDEINHMTFFKQTPFTMCYYKTFYKNPYIVSYKFINSQMALKIFFEEGGMIDAKELNTLNFQNLYDDKFVLNRALVKSKYDI